MLDKDDHPPTIKAPTPSIYVQAAQSLPMLSKQPGTFLLVNQLTLKATIKHSDLTSTLIDCFDNA